MKAPSPGFTHPSSAAKSLSTFPPKRDFSSLSIKDLLDAREAYHVQLSSLENVVATAIGRYLIRRGDWYDTHSPDVPRPDNVPKPTGARTLDNSVIRAWSWPAVLVFVRSWGNEGHGESVPRSLYLPDGRVIPTCVVLAAPDESLPPDAVGPSQVSPLVGGGYSCLRSDQGVDHLGTFSCLVDKEGSYYALTNRHVAGQPGAEIRAYIGGEYVRVGESVGSGLSKLRMSEAFPAWTGLSTNLAFDAGLVRIDRLSAWTSQVFGIGEIGELFSATENSLTLDLIGTPVRAFGGTSGVMQGEIRALFFQYKSVGGADYATDVLIGARENAKAGTSGPLTRPGDSGTLWFYDPPSAPPPPSPDLLAHAEAPDRGLRARRLRPIAMQWGGQRFVDEQGKSSAFALGSFLSTVCRELDFEIVRDWSTGHSEYWGKLGHFAIGWKACDCVTGNLKTLMGLNQKHIGFDDATLGLGKQFKMGTGGFVPLADVPDYVWVHSSRSDEGMQHFADVDIHDIDGGDSMIERCHDDPSNCSATKWKEYFDGFEAAGVGPDAGVLPFRVWQIWDAMVASLKAPSPDVKRFVAAAGVLAHYVGDASQPLHCSYMHHGVPPMKTHAGRKYPVRKETDAFKAFKKTPQADIHSLYEEGMLEVDTPTVMVSVNVALNGAQSDPDAIASGFDAAKATMALMYEAQKRLSPRKIIQADDPSLGPTARAQRLWNNATVRDATIASLAQSVKLLATLWQGAWKVGGGDALPADALVEFSEADLQDLYRNHDDDFVPSLSLDQMASSGNFEPPP